MYCAHSGPVPLAFDTSSESSAEPVCVDEEADVFALLEEAGAAAAGEPLRSNSDDEDDGHSVSSSSAVDSDAAAVGNFVEQVMLHQSAGSEDFSRDDQTIERQRLTEPDVTTTPQLQAPEEDSARSDYTLTPSLDADILSKVAQETPPKDVLCLPESTKPFSDAAISDEDDVEEDIENSLQDAFAALEAEMATKRFSVPFGPQSSLVIQQDSSSDDDEASPGQSSKITPHEQRTTSAVSTETAVTTENTELSAVTDERLRVDDTADARTDSPTTFHYRSPEADAALEQQRAQSAEGGDVVDRGDLSRTELHTKQMSPSVFEKSTDCDTQVITKTEIPLLTEKHAFVAKSTVEEDENTALWMRSDDDQEVNCGHVDAENGTVNDGSTELGIVEKTNVEVAAETTTGCLGDGTEPSNSAEPTAQNVEEQRGDVASAAGGPE